MYEPPSKSIVDAWYENIGYRFFWGPYRFTVFCSNQDKTINKKKQRNWLQGFRSLNCWEWIKGRSLSLRLQPCWGAI